MSVSSSTLSTSNDTKITIPSSSTPLLSKNSEVKTTACKCCIFVLNVLTGTLCCAIVGTVLTFENGNPRVTAIVISLLSFLGCWIGLTYGLMKKNK